MKVLIIDNYDSFTFNLYQLTGEVLYEEFSNEINDIIVKRNDEVSLSEIKKNNPPSVTMKEGKPDLTTMVPCIHPKKSVKHNVINIASIGETSAMWKTV